MTPATSESHTARSAASKLEDWQAPSVTSHGREPMHALLSGRENCSGAPGETSLCLDGEWQFHLAVSPEACPEGFFEEDFDDSAWIRIPVPSNWQLQPSVNDLPIYTNTAYPFHADPPHLPECNETGLYRRTFDAPAFWLERDVRLVFESVDSAFHVWVNGRLVGYAEDSRLPSEFAIIRFLRTGQNTIAVRVLKYCTGSYLEDQDYWHMSGIQRSVHLSARPPVHIRDYRILTGLDFRYEDAVLDVTVYLETRTLPAQPPATFRVSNYEDWAARIRLLDAFGEIVEESGAETFPGQTPMYGKPCEIGAARFQMPVTAPLKWSPDQPNLYTLEMELLDLGGTTVDLQTSRVGFRQIEIKNRQVLLNGRRLTLSGELGRQIAVTGSPQFHFSALHHSPDDLAKARHSWELAPRRETYLVLEGWQMGVGGDTGWTPNVHPEYLIGPGTYRWAATLHSKPTP